MRKMTTLLTVLGLSVASLTAASTAPAQSDTSGKVTLESTSVAIGVGVSWGDGILEYRGKTYPFKFRGLNGVDLGVSKITARGQVQNLKELEDFDGNYILAAAGGTVGGGAGVGRSEEPERRRDGADRDGAGHRVLAFARWCGDQAQEIEGRSGWGREKGTSR